MANEWPERPRAVTSTTCILGTMRKKRRRTSLFTPEERAAQQTRLEALEERIRRGEAEFEASGSVFACVPRRERLAFALSRAVERGDPA